MLNRDELREALTFDDVLLVPGESDVLPKMVETATRFTRNIQLNIPIVSAAMDTVTEARMAIAMAAEGGLGFIHKNLSVEEQAPEVDKVKKQRVGMVVDPVTIEPEARLAHAVALMREHGISGIPVVAQGQAGRHPHQPRPALREEPRAAGRGGDDEELVTAREGVTIEEAKELLHRHRIEKLLVVNEAFELRGPDHHQGHREDPAAPATPPRTTWAACSCGAAVGVGADREARVAALLKAGADVIVIDTAHGHSQGVIEAVRATKANFKGIELVAGNVATAEAADALCEAGVDAVKVGIGPGSICTTRMVAGVGVPADHRRGRLRSRRRASTACPSSPTAASSTRATWSRRSPPAPPAVMIGSLLAGTEEAPGEVILYQGRSYKAYRGMGSIGAMKEGSQGPLLPGRREPTPRSWCPRASRGACRTRARVAHEPLPAGGRPAQRHGLPGLPHHRRAAAKRRASSASPAPGCARATCTT